VFVCVCVRLCGCVWFVCLVVLYCYVAGSYPVFLLNGMKRSSPAFSREKKESGEDTFFSSQPLNYFQNVWYNFTDSA
jgi:hypothetical protein